MRVFTVYQPIVKTDFHSVKFSDWAKNLLFTCENVALN